MRRGEGGLFVYTCFIDASIECVYDALEYVLGKFQTQWRSLMVLYSCG